MDKPFKTIDEQIAILNRRGAATDGSAHSTLIREGYYSIVNGYKDPFIDSEKKQRAAGEDMFQDGVTFNHIYRLFRFDRDLRTSMFKYFVIAEAALKTVCAYRFTERYSTQTDSYLDARCYSRERSDLRGVERLIDDFNYILGNDPNNQPKIKRDYIKHYTTNHDAVPLWVLTNYLSLGTIFKFYTYQKEAMRNSVAMSFSKMYEETNGIACRIHPEDLRLAYDHIKDFRNICAHDERLYCAKVSPSKDMLFSDVLDDISLVIPRDDVMEMKSKVASLLIGLSKDLPLDSYSAIQHSMGIESLETTLLMK